jgi:FkbM family methyltransferase
MSPERWQAFYDRARTNGQLFEHVIRDVYTKGLPANAVALDGGANVGYHTLGLAQHLRDGKVIAVEANQATHAELTKNVRGITNVQVVFGALQDSEMRQTIEFHCSASHPGRSGLQRLWDRISPGEVKYESPQAVPATTIDRLVRESQVTRLDFIKLDLEGGEYHALRGASEALRMLRPLVVSEHASQSPAVNGFAINDYLDWLSSLAYVPMAPTGVPIERSRPYPFWYIFLVPVEQLSVWPARIASALEGHA